MKLENFEKNETLSAQNNLNTIRSTAERRQNYLGRGVHRAVTQFPVDCASHDGGHVSMFNLAARAGDG